MTDPKSMPDARTRLYYIHIERFRGIHTNNITRPLAEQFEADFNHNIVDYATLLNLVQALNLTASQTYQKIKREADAHDQRHFRQKPVKVKLDLSDPDNVTIYPCYVESGNIPKASFVIHVRRIPRVRIQNLPQFINRLATSDDCSFF